MLSFVFFGMMLMAGSAQAEYNCSMPIYQLCAEHGRPPSFPQSETQIREACVSVLGFLKCAKNVTETCDEHASLFPKFNAPLSVAQDICNENSSLHRVIVDNIQCVSGLQSRPDLCQPSETKVKIDEYVESLKDQGIPYVGITEDDSRLCESQMNTIACPTAAIGKECGTDMKDALLEIFGRLVVPLARCREEMIGRLEEIVELYKFEEVNDEDSSQAEYNCSLPIYQLCAEHARPPFFPQSESQIRDVCIFALGFLKCAKNVTETCDEHLSQFTKFNELLSVAQDVCHENSSLYRAIAENIPCMGQVLSQRGLCDPSVTKVKVDDYVESLKDQGIPYVGITEDDSRLCKSQINTIACPTATFGKQCSTDIKDALLEAFRRLVVPVARCREEMIGHLEPIVELYEVEPEEVKEEDEGSENTVDK